MHEIESANSSFSCIKDEPIHKENDKLNAYGYAQALCNFINNADTPITIGIQGGWGSGKTSLFMLMQSILTNERNSLFVVLNAWEHSLFANQNNQANVVLSILQALIEAITEEINKKYDFVDEIPGRVIGEMIDRIKSGVSTLTKYVPIFAQLTMFGTAVSVAKDDKDSTVTEFSRMVGAIKKVKKALNDLVNKIKKNGIQLKTIIFIDDLDRVSPPIAVQILDVLKNIFDIDNCIFVLAIDYEVIVKGLEARFGERSDKNEREFRQYFDKIIQIPFTMPMGAYSHAIKYMLNDSFKNLDAYKSMDMDKIIDTITSVAQLATGGIPRSIKRILNTLSLLQYVAESTGENIEQNNREKYLEIRFIIVALLINFPEICKRLMEKPDFTSWKINDLNTSWQLNYEDCVDELHEIEKNEELKYYFCEQWEQVIYCLCSKSSWLKLRAYNISRIMNTLKNILNDIYKESYIKYENKATNSELPKSATNVLENILASISIVSVDVENKNMSGNINYEGIIEETHLRR